MKEVLNVLLPRLIGPRPVSYKVIDHGSKRALLQALPTRLSGYASWRSANLRVLTLVDRDDDDCLKLKARLEAIALDVGFATKARPDRCGAFTVVNRVVVEELEAWFFGDLSAVAAAFPGVPPTLDRRASYRDSDAVMGGTCEALLRVLKKAGYFAGVERLPKIEVARRVAAAMDAKRNRSRSFQAFAAGLEALVAG